MVTNDFDPTEWLDRWTDAGGAWAIPYLLKPIDDPATYALLHRMERELSAANRAALIVHMANMMGQPLEEIL